MKSISKKLRDGEEIICAKCGETLGKPSIDHIYEKIDGGSGFLRNKQTLCEVPCHSQKTKLFLLLRTTSEKKKLTFEESHALNDLYLTGIFDGLLRKKQIDAIMALFSERSSAASRVTVKVKESGRQ